MLELKNLYVERDRARKIHLLYNLAIKRGEQVLISGKSGAGKSTLLLLISGLLAANSGEILLDKRPMTQKDLIDKVAILFQEDNLFSHLSVKQNISLGIAPRFKLNRTQEIRLTEVIRSLRISELLESKYPHEISGGQRQRVGLARALLQEREFLLLDEPFSSLQAPLRSELLALTRSICSNRGITLLVVSHDEIELDREIRI